MNFINYQQMVTDIKAWSNQLPQDLVAVAGIPRSGMLPATLLSLHFNIHLVSLNELLRGEKPWTKPLRRTAANSSAGPILVVDDSARSGATLRQVRGELQGKGNFVFGALYYDQPLPDLLDVTFRNVTTPRCFEWNLFHCYQMQFTCIDLDGVICEDWVGREEESGPGLARYLEHLDHARPKYIPSKYPVQAIVTARLEKYRSQTEAWLKRHNVKYRKLIMAPHRTASARRAAEDNARRKADAYTAHKNARLFIESDCTQSREISRLTERPVLCADTMQMYYN